MKKNVEVVCEFIDTVSQEFTDKDKRICGLEDVENQYIIGIANKEEYFKEIFEKKDAQIAGLENDYKSLVEFIEEAAEQIRKEK
ncbi:hypothetical protein LCGC14_0758060 [marine sediment metagenome]|uniref:Uncharacterized protein n=1 Tax=marine sediment metagenome TaxID=412755 RepID=A0A0F9Q636_9ZZZZ